jgi:hypothetical protein
MNDSFAIVQDQLGPVLEATLTKGDGTAQNLTGATVTFYMEKRSTGTIKVNGGAVTLVDATNGKVRYSWAGTDTDTPGIYRAQWHVAGLSPTPVRFPTAHPGYFVVHVVPKVS